METRAKDLKDLTMWNRSNSRIKFLDLSDTILSQGLFFDCDFATSSSQINGEGFSKFDNEFAMPFLYDQIRMDLSTYIEQSMSCHNPFVTISFKKLISRFFKSCRTGSLKCFLKPVKQPDVCIGDFQNTSIVTIFIAIIRFVFKFAGVKASFSVDHSSKISQVKRIMDFGFVKNSVFMVFIVELHKTPLFNKFTNQCTREVHLSPG